MIVKIARERLVCRIDTISPPFEVTGYIVVGSLEHGYPAYHSPPSKSVLTLSTF